MSDTMSNGHNRGGTNLAGMRDGIEVLVNGKPNVEMADPEVWGEYNPEAASVVGDGRENVEGPDQAVWGPNDTFGEPPQ